MSCVDVISVIFLVQYFFLLFKALEALKQNMQFATAAHIRAEFLAVQKRAGTIGASLYIYLGKL